MSGEPGTSNLPANTAFKQQRLPAWQPVLTAKNVLPTFIVIGITFLGLGIALLITSNGLYEQTKEYTDCTNGSGDACSTQLENSIGSECLCDLTVTIEQDIQPPVYFYYKLTNFYQNHRLYVKSRDNSQLNGNTDVVNDASKLSKDCNPYREIDGKPIAPCGAIANSLFNDTFTLENESNNPINMDKSNIAWKTDHTTKFNNPVANATCKADPATEFQCSFGNSEKPPFWQKPIYEVSDIVETSSEQSENGYENQALEVWMRTAAFPTFRKLYAISYEPVSKGNYTLKVKYNYPTSGFKGTKSFVIAQVGWAGGKNPFLGIAYIVVGCLSLVAAVALFFVHKYSSKKAQD